MQSLAVYKTESYEDEVLYNAIKKHFDAHNIAREIPEGAKVLLKPNLVLQIHVLFLRSYAVFVK